LAHLIAGLLQPKAGSATTFPIDRISAVIYPCDFIPGTVRDNISFASATRDDEAFKRLACDLRLEDYLDKDPSELSAGQRKRLEVLITLLKGAEIYVFDEPLAGVDVESKGTVMRRIFTYTKGKTLIIIMHGDAEFHSFFDRVIHLG
jgi:ATP-binding cassette subfamily B protein